MQCKRYIQDGACINYYIRKDMKERLDKYCEDVAQTNTLAVERICAQFLDEYEKSIPKDK